MVRWAQESVIEDPELVRAMFVLLHRQYDGIGGQVCVYLCVPQNLILILGFLGIMVVYSLWSLELLGLCALIIWDLGYLETSGGKKSRYICAVCFAILY